jgi:16S rRNA (cytosine967-C5)-methyltransferase
LLAQVLPASGKQGASLRIILEKSLPSTLNDSDRGLLFDLCFGVCRHFRLLSDWLDCHMDKHLKPSAQLVRLALCCGLYELWFTERPAHAVVNVWPDVCRRLKQPWAAHLANALLRKASQMDIAAWRASRPAAIAASLPDWLYQQWCEDWPDQVEDIVEASLSVAPLVLRNNRLQQSRDELQRRLEESGITSHPGTISEHSLYLEHAQPVERIPGFTEGACSVQDEAAQLPATLISLPTRGRLLDACAAPGGKTGQLCELHPEARISALDVDEKRLEKVGANLRRIRCEATLLHGDASTPATWWDGIPFDAILLDAPCSATGILRRQPDGKWHKDSRDLTHLVLLQQKLLNALWPLLKPGGNLVYATCSIDTKENAGQVANFLTSHPDARDTTPPHASSPDNKHGWQLLPAVGGWDGFFLARLEKMASL